MIHPAKYRVNKQKNPRLTVERISADSLDVRELKQFGLLQDDRMALSAGLRWPALRRIISSRYWLELEGLNTTQRIRVSWTRCQPRRLAPMDALPLLRSPEGNIAAGLWRILLPVLYRQPNVRKPGQKQPWPSAFRDLQAPAATKRDGLTN